MDTTEDPIARQWSRSRMGARMYDAIAQRQWLAGPLGRLMWGDDWRCLYSDIAALRDLPAGTRVLDVPCGGGVALRGIRPGAGIRYVAADVSPLMLDRARAEAGRRGLAGVEFVRASVYEMPFEDGGFDVCVCYNGLHCFPDTRAAAAELARVLRPGGRLRGTAVVTGGGALTRACIKIFQRTDQFGPVGGTEDLRRLLAAAGFTGIELDVRGAYALFSARRPG